MNPDAKLGNYFSAEEKRTLTLLQPFLPTGHAMPETVWFPDHEARPFGTGVYRLAILVHEPQHSLALRLEIETSPMEREQALWEFIQQIKGSHEKLMQREGPPRL